MAAILYSVKQVSPGLEYEISPGTGVSFVLAVAFSWAFWRLVFGKRKDLNDALSRPRRRWFVALSFLLTVATLVPFVYALKDLANDKAGEVVQGTAFAVIALAAVGFLFWRVTRYLNADSQRNAGPEDKLSEPK